MTQAEEGKEAEKVCVMTKEEGVLIWSWIVATFCVGGIIGGSAVGAVASGLGRFVYFFSVFETFSDRYSRILLSLQERWITLEQHFDDHFRNLFVRRQVCWILGNVDYWPSCHWHQFRTQRRCSPHVLDRDLTHRSERSRWHYLPTHHYHFHLVVSSPRHEHGLGQRCWLALPFRSHCHSWRFAIDHLTFLP